MTITNRNKIAARSGELILWVRRVRGITTWEMNGGQFGPHTLREPTYNARVAAHWGGYLLNNGHKIDTSNIPDMVPA